MKHALIIAFFIAVTVLPAAAQDIESKLSGNTATQGFTVKDNSSVNIFTVRGDGKVGIGTATPTANLHVSGLNGILSTGTFGSGTLAATGAGTRLLWYPNKAAFRVGSVGGTQWDDANIGSYSTAMGRNTTASGNWSTAMGVVTTASGYYSTAIGYGTTAQSLSGLAIGRYNVGGGTSNSWVASDPVFEIGIGSSSSVKANALTVLKNGNVGIGTTTPTQALEVAGTAKADVHVSQSSLGSSATPASGGVYADNVVYAWANVASTGTVTGGFGCSVTKRVGSTGVYDISYIKTMSTGNFSPVATVSHAAPSTFKKLLTISESTVSGCTVRLWNWNSTNKDWDEYDGSFNFQLVGRP